MKNIFRLLFFTLIIINSTSCNKDEFNESTDSGTFVDSRDGKKYKWIKIGDQIWMAENLAYLPKVSPPTEGSDSAPYYYVYGYEGTSVSKAKSTSNYKKYGVLYNWSAVMQGEAPTNENPSDVKGISPQGWHIPSNAEWEQLAEFISDNSGPYEIWQEGWTGIGIHLKSTGTIEDGNGYWINAEDSVQGIDDYGFNALPGGCRVYDWEEFNGINYSGDWWSCTENYNNLMWERMLNFERSELFSSFANKAYGYSVRCVKDLE
jgi:uncharacterized protein (TIGR02145 family)